MTSPADLYIKGIHDHFGYFGTWLPNAPIALGDVGFRKGRSFSRVSSLKQLKIPFRIRTGTSPMRFQHSWHSHLQGGLGVSGSSEFMGVGATTEVIIEFERAGAFVFQAENCMLYEIEEKVALARAVADVHDRGAWDPDWSVVDTIVHADFATILVANSNGARIELSCGTGLPGVIGSLACAELDLRVRSQRGDVTRFLAERELVPLFRLSRPHMSVLRRLSSTGKKPSITFGGRGSSVDEGVPPVSESDLWELLSPEPTE